MKNRIKESDFRNNLLVKVELEKMTTQYAGLGNLKSTESKIQAEKSMDDAVLDTAYFGKNGYLKGKRAVLLLAVIILYIA